MRVLIVADGTRGDVQPMTVLAQQLQREGQDVTFAGPPTFRSFVESKGLTFTPLPFDSEAMIKAHPGAVTGGLLETLRLAPKLFVQTTEGQLSVVPQLAQRADFILVGGVHAGVPSSAEYARIPWRWVVYTSIMYPSSSHPPMTAALGRAPRLVNWVLWRLTRWLMNHMFRAPINRHRARLGLPKLTDVTRHILCRNPILAMEPELAPIPPEWPDADVIGYLDPGDGDPLPPEIEAFLARGPAPVYIGFGSMPDRQPRETTQLFVEATRRAGVRAVISRGWADFGEELPEHCIAVASVSHPRLFARMSAIVHHGGAGTTAASARAGKPQLIVPHIADQFFFGNLVHELGVGLRPIRRTRLDVEVLAQRLRTLASGGAMHARAAELGATIRARPRPENLSRLLVMRPGASLPVVPLGRRISIAPPGMGIDNSATD
jgi:vancomycin aglycone glucosyltransferase